MPLDSGCIGERPTRPASKNAKDKSNSAALLASRARAHMQQEAKGRESRCSSEKDSGYSDTGSDSLQTDAEDQRSVSEQKHHKTAGVQGVSDQGKHLLVSAPPELTPIFIIKNVVLKQPGQPGQEHVLQSPLGWGSGGANLQTPTHLLLLHQPGVGSPPSHLHKSQRQRVPESGGGKKSKSTYLPILNSYPRIAPHPSKKTPDKPPASRGSNADEPSRSKRVCTEEKREEVSTSTQAATHKQQDGRHKQQDGRHKQQDGRHKQQDGRPKHRSLCPSDALLSSHQRRSPRPPCSPSTLSLGSPSVSSSETSSPPSACESNKSLQPPSSKGLQRHTSGLASDSDAPPVKGPLTTSVKHRRFLNTVEILSQSGLLDITLRTQELLRQSTATEQDIAQLREHTQLLCQAAQASSCMPEAWAQLHQVMSQSGCYPSLKSVVLETIEDRQPEVNTSTKLDAPAAYGYGINRSEVIEPPSPLLAPMVSPPAFQGSGSTSPGYGRGHRVSVSLLDEILMPPDSSTHGGLL